VLPTAGLKPDLVTDSTDKEDESDFTDVTQSYDLHEYRAIIQKPAEARQAQRHEELPMDAQCCWNRATGRIHHLYDRIREHLQ